MLEISSQLILNIQVTHWKFPVGSKLNLLFFDMLEALKNSEKMVKLHGTSLAYSFQNF